MVGSESERAGVHRGRARVGVSCIAEREGAGAVFGEAACAADHTGVGGVAGGVRGEGEACEIQGPRTGDGSEVLVGSESERAGVHRGRARVGVSCIAEREGAGAVVGEAACAADHAGVGAVTGGICGEGVAREVQRSRSGDGSEVLVGAEGERAGVNRSRAGVGVRTGERECACAFFCEAATPAAVGKVRADGEGEAWVDIDHRATGFHHGGDLTEHREGVVGSKCAAIEVDR